MNPSGRLSVGVDITGLEGHLGQFDRKVARLFHGDLKPNRAFALKPSVVGVIRFTLGNF